MLGRLLEELTAGADTLASVARTGILRPQRPDKLARMALELQRRGPLAATCTAAAIRSADDVALIDERGPLTYGEIDERSNAIARAWLADGVSCGDGIAILARNHRGFVEAFFAAAKAGLRIVLVNTEFAGPQIADVCAREGVSSLVFDAEYADRAPAAERHFCAWSDDGAAGAADATLDELAAAHSGAALDPPPDPPTLVLLTSGTTGAPKGAPREQGGGSVISAVSMLGQIPFRARRPIYVAPPFFHALGLSTLLLGFGFGSAVVSTRHFSAPEMLERLARHRCAALVAVPAMLQRTLELGPDELARHDTSALRLILSAGSQLPGPTATGLLEAFGDVLYVLYGSTEISYVSIAAPSDLRAAPTTVGPLVRGVRVALLDEAGEPLGEGESGRIFVSNGMEFSGYTDGQTKEVIGGLMSTGDVGHFDRAGRLYIDGRDDEMIVSGGENVFPQEVEELLAGHPEIAEAAVIGVADPEFGRRLAAYVVPVAGADPGVEAVRAYVRDNLARYKVPREVHFLDQLPRNATGKVLKRSLGGEKPPEQ